ncbi:endonuclease [Tenacibaculum discolor]|uniref:endonuclease n=1 Tax=Tenacibaculum discolor TaxID=361581 RepID=UPI003F795F1B
MKHKLLFFLLIASLSIFSQVPSYYNDVNLNLSGSALKNELATKIINTHTTNLSYTPGVWNALKQTDLDPNDPSKVLLIYGYSDTDGNYVTDRTRDKDANGGTAGTQWNREHVYAKSLGNPNLGTSVLVLTHII